MSYSCNRKYTTSQTCCRRMIKTEEKAKDRRWCLADGIYSILCHASYFALEYFEGWIAPGWFEEKDEFILFFKIVLKLTWRPLPFLLYLFYDPKYRVVCVKWLYIYHVVFPSYYHNFIPISHYFLWMTSDLGTASSFLCSENKLEDIY